MSFDSMPTESLLQIFSYLQFKDLVRIGGVNRLFNQLSRESIDHMKSLDVSDDLVKYSMWSCPIRKLLESCSPDLERIKAVQPCSMKELFELLPEFSYPNLARLEFAVAPSLDDDYVQSVGKCFEKLIKRNRNIRSITLRLAYSLEFPIDDIIFDRLENLEIYAGIDDGQMMEDIYGNNGGDSVSFNELIQSLTGRVPNLKRLTVQTCEEDGPNLVDVSNLHPILNQFIASVPNLKSLHLVSDSDALISSVIDDFSNMWNLSSLVDLQFDIYNDDCGFQYFDQTVMNKISTSFPRLQSIMTNGIRNGDDALLTLKGLKHLRKICLPKLVTDMSIFFEILQLFPSLQWLEIRRIDTVPSIESFRDVLTCIASSKQILIINIVNIDGPIGDAENMKLFLREIKENGGPIIDIKNIKSTVD